MSLKRIQITSEQKENLEAISGQNLLLKNTFSNSQEAVTSLMDQAVLNAAEYLKRKRLGQRLNLYEENNIQKALRILQAELNIPSLPQRMECYDISHLQGTYVYGSMVVFIGGKPAKKLYRLFKTKEQNNDFENLKEVIRRRIERFLKHKDEISSTWSLPQLMVIDGGKGQLSSVMEVVNEYQNGENQVLFSGMQVVALAKQEELVFLPQSSIPLRFEGLPRFLLQRLRDETHRFGIKNNRNARLKAAHTTKLESIQGVGKLTAQRLLKEFGSVENLTLQLSDNYLYVEEIVGSALARKLCDFFAVPVGGVKKR